MSDGVFFYLSKLVWLVTNPGMVLLAGLVLGVLLLWTRWWRRGRGLLLAVGLFAVLIATVPIGPMLLIPLEQRFAKPHALPGHVAGIVVLGGGIAHPTLSAARGYPELGGSVDRLTETAVLSRRYPGAKVVFTGGTGKLLKQEFKEADVLGPTFRLLGLGARGRLILENRSRNTHENAVNSHALVKPKPGETWILVTSAFHMPRAVGVFRKAGWPVVPYPVDYQFTGAEASRPTLDLIDGLRALNRGLHEWLGLAAYRVTGKTDAFFPAP